MTVVAPPPRDDAELLIREARARRRRRWLAGAVVLALLTGGGLGLASILAGGTPSTSKPAPAVGSGRACGVRGVGVRILSPHGGVLYREPGHYQHPDRGFPTIRCSGSSIWAVFVNGVASSQEAYFGVHSGDGGRTWQPVFTERYFGMRAPHQLDAYLGPWTVRGRAAYFTGLCPACGRQPTISLWVTKDGGRSFRRYEVPALETWWPSGIRVVGNVVTLIAHRGARRKSASVQTG